MDYLDIVAAVRSCESPEALVKIIAEEGIGSTWINEIEYASARLTAEAEAQASPQEPRPYIAHHDDHGTLALIDEAKTAMARIQSGDYSTDYERQVLVNRAWPWFTVFDRNKYHASFRVTYDGASDSVMIFEPWGNFITSLLSPEKLWVVLQREEANPGVWYREVTGRECPTVASENRAKAQRDAVDEWLVSNSPHGDPKQITLEDLGL